MLLNKVLYEELESLYGIGSRIEISSINVLSRKNETIISYKIFYTNEEYFAETMETGTNFLLEESWSKMGYPKTKLIFVTSYEKG
jgi:hypothetical protein